MQAQRSRSDPSGIMLGAVDSQMGIVIIDHEP
jgi:hypothetical protein